MEITFLEFMIISLASFRLTRLIVFDSITGFLRAPFLQEETVVNEDGGKEFYYVPREGKVRGFFGELVSCPWCTGVWAAAAVYLAYFFWPEYSLPVIMILAIAGSAAVIEVIIRLLNDD